MFKKEIENLEIQKPSMVKDRKWICQDCGNKYNNKKFASCPYCAESKEDPEEAT